MRGFVGGRPGGRRIYTDEDKSNKDAIYLTCVSSGLNEQRRGVLVQGML
jgi:hypothetical protein